MLTKRIVSLVKGIPLALKVQVPAPLVRREQWLTNRRLNVVISIPCKISLTYLTLLID